MATIKDIARETGLGIATVSKYLNGGNVRAENRVLLDDAVKKLGYTMNNAARALKTSKTKMIGIVIPELSNLFITTILTEVEDILRRSGYGVLVTDCRSNVELERASVDFLLSRQVDGIINMPVGISKEHLVNAAQKGVPVVLVDRFIQGAEFDFIGVDNVLAGELATDLLVKAGHTGIAIISGAQNISTANDRVVGYKNSLKRHSIPLYEPNIVYSDFTIEGGYQSMKKLLQSNKSVTAVFTTNYEITVGAIIALNELGIKIPQELSMVGFDNIELSRVITPKLTIVAQPIMDIAVKTAEIMLTRLYGEGKAEKLLLKPYIEYGGTIKQL